jgi:hypothetical protein
VKTLFLKPKLEGTRFREHSVPIELLKDWAAFEELIVEVARWLYLKDNPDRRRVPRGFMEQFALYLSGVEAGSAVPVLERISADGSLPIIAGDFFDRARDVVIKTIATAAVGGSIIGYFPPELLGYFDLFGRSLRDGERIALVAPGEESPVVYDKAVRKRLVLLAAKEYRSAADLRGSITEVDAEKRTFTLKLLGGQKLEGTFLPELAKTVFEALAEFETSKVLVRCVVVYDQNDRAKKIDETSHIEILEANDVPTRLEELSLLKNGWLDGDGQALPAEGVEWFSNSWETFFPNELPLPYAPG